MSDAKLEQPPPSETATLAAQNSELEAPKQFEIVLTNGPRSCCHTPSGNSDVRCVQSDIERAVNEKNAEPLKQREREREREYEARLEDINKGSRGYKSVRTEAQTRAIFVIM